MVYSVVSKLSSVVNTYIDRGEVEREKSMKIAVYKVIEVKNIPNVEASIQDMRR